LAFPWKTIDEDVDPTPQNPFPDGFSDLFFEGQVFPRHSKLQVQMAMVQAANLNRDFRPPHQMSGLTVPRHTLHNLSLMTRLSFFMATATVPTSSPTKPAARLAITAASS